MNHEIKHSRRHFIIKASYSSALLMLSPVLSACEGASSVADGSFDYPWTSQDAGAIDPALEKPVAFISQSSEKDNLLQLWVEVLDPSNGQLHPQEEAHFISQITVLDDLGNRLSAQKFTDKHQARFIFSTPFSADIKNIHVYRECSEHGWWKESYTVGQGNFSPEGDIRRAYTNQSNGDFKDEKSQHIPQLYKEGNNGYRIEIGSREDLQLHPMEVEHYISEIVIFDDYHQKRFSKRLSPNFDQEAVILTEDFQNTKWIRILILCNQHKWWQVIYDL